MSKRISLILGLILLVIICSPSFFNQHVSQSEIISPLAKNIVNPSKSPKKLVMLLVSPTPASKPLITQVPTYIPLRSHPTPSPTNFQNFGWYVHDGKSMQYLNGEWYTTPQQANTPTPTPTPTYSCPPGVQDYYCRQECINISESECSNKYNYWWMHHLYNN